MLNTTDVKNFLTSINGKCEHIDLPYFWEPEFTTVDELRDAIEDGSGFDVEIIYYSRAIEYLSKNDPSLKESLSISEDCGYDLKNLSSEVLASLHASQAAREEFEAIADEIEKYLEKATQEEEV